MTADSAGQPMNNPAGIVQQRIGDAERDRATEYLREHMASGRLDAAEFDERLEKALTAHFQSDLDQLFTDLPAPRPQPATRATTPPPPAEPASAPMVADAPGSATTPPTKSWGLVVGLAWVAAIALSVLSGWHLWWLIFVPLLMSGGFGGHHHQRRHLQHRQMRMQQMQLRQMHLRQLHARGRGMH